MKNLTYRHTQYASYLGYVTQAIVNNLAPLLFVIFQDQFVIPLHKITLLITTNFCFQLVVDFIAARIVDRIGYRPCIIAAHLFATAGLVGMAVLPHIFSDPYYGLLTAVLLYAVGGGLIEVLISPIVEACPTDNKSSVMSLLHSFYCWGAVGVILGSTLFFTFFGVDNWKILACVWALIPLYNIINFTTCPIEPIVEDANGMNMGQLLKNQMFWIFLLLMVAAGASECTMAQWASAFAEASLGVDKAVGDLAGPCGFAFCMGLGRLWYGKKGQNLDLTSYMTGAGILCFAAYLTASLSTIPHISLIGCMINGLAVGIMWPGSISITSKRIPTGGTAMFAMLALAGDMGGTLGPSLVGICTKSSENIQNGLLAASVFPVILVVCLFRIRRYRR